MIINKLVVPIHDILFHSSKTRTFFKKVNGTRTVYVNKSETKCKVGWPTLVECSTVVTAVC